MPRLFITGVPGCAKTSFTRWLAAEHGYERRPVPKAGLRAEGSG